MTMPGPCWAVTKNLHKGSLTNVHLQDPCSYILATQYDNMIYILLKPYIKETKYAA